MGSIKSWGYSTRDGVFRIESVLVNGAWYFKLSMNEIDLGVFAHPATAARSIGEGKHDQVLLFAASKLGVPASPYDWNELT